MRSVVSVNPFRCKLWPLHDRLEEHVTEQSCRLEIDSFSKHGQLIPVLGRRLRDDPDYDFELIFGARRLFVARHLNMPIGVEICELSDRQAIVAMDTENRHRKDISPYERGLSYARWLRSGHFKSQQDIAQALHISASQVSRLVKLGRLPSVILGVFSDTIDICEGWGLELSDALEDPRCRKRIIETARLISTLSPRPSNREIYHRLISASAAGRKPRRSTRDRVVSDDSGEPLFRIQYRRDAIAVLLPIKKTSDGMLAAVERAITEAILSSQHLECKASSRSIPIGATVDLTSMSVST